MKSKSAIVLLSGGIDSAVTLYYALNKGYQLKVLIFNYGQRHRREIDSATKIAQQAKLEYRIVRIGLPWGGSRLLDPRSKLPSARLSRRGIPPTYVPARNIIFLSYALSYAEAVGFKSIFIGANAIDFSGYPDCRPEFIKAFQRVAEVGTKSGSQGRAIKIQAPLINLRKSEIIKLGIKLKVPFELTWSCYRGGKFPCARCDSCLIREKGFQEAGENDPLIESLRGEKRKRG